MRKMVGVLLAPVYPGTKPFCSNVILYAVNVGIQ